MRGGLDAARRRSLLDHPMVRWSSKALWRLTSRPGEVGLDAARRRSLLDHPMVRWSSKALWRLTSRPGEVGLDAARRRSLLDHPGLGSLLDHRAVGQSGCRRRC